MASVSDQLLTALDHLVTEQLKRFKRNLRIDYSVSASDLEKADAPDTVDLMMAHFGPEEAVKITVKILRKMNQNHRAEELEKKHEQDQAENSRQDPAPARVESEPINETFTNIVPRTRNDLLQYSHQLILDLNTVNKRLLLSQNNTVITNTYTVQQYPAHPDRFDVCQVLCGESVCGRCYWEIEWRGYVDISVSYKSIRRKRVGDECLFGSNDQSWSLICSPSSYSFRHNKIKTDLSVKPIIFRRTGEFDDGFRRRTGEFDDMYRTGVFDDGFRRTGVYVDESEGTLSFYSISDTMRLIHTVQTTFTQTLCPGFTVCSGSVKLC